MYKIVKRAGDIFFSVLLIIMLSPILLLITSILYVQLKKHPFFKQVRPGLNEDLFNVIKFQTMLDLRDDSGKLLPDTQRITRFGGLLRKNSLDELPQLFNVLFGKMSFVGPRPLLQGYLKHYSAFQKKRHNVRPGITGWAQVNGRNSISWEKKFEFDVFYVQNQSFLLDFKILVMTFFKVLRRKDIQTSSNVTMELFVGSKEEE